MDIPKYFHSLTLELEALKDRVRNFIEDAHWLTDGEWKESVLRSMIAERLPDAVRIAHGFVLTPAGPTTQCDILLYRADSPVLFRQGDLVFLTPDAVLAVIEVKSRATSTVLKDAIAKLAAIGRILGPERHHCSLGLFAYESELKNDERTLTYIQELCPELSDTVNFVNLGCSTFIRFWDTKPFKPEDSDPYDTWHAYDLKNMSAGYFITNILDDVSPVELFSGMWYPDAKRQQGLNVTATKEHLSKRTREG